MWAVNVYVLASADGLTLVDGGWRCREAKEALRDGLHSIGRDPSEINLVLATHVHRDHYSLALWLRHEFGARIALGSAERRSLEAAQSAQHTLATSAFPRLARSGADRVVEALLAAGDATRARNADFEQPDLWIEDGERIPVGGGHQLTAIRTPGHTRGHLCFADDERNILFGGDHVLPHITPSVGMEPVQDPLALRDYLDSLARIRAGADRRLLPAHGAPAPTCHARIDALLAHHDRRLADCLEAVVHGGASAYDVAAALRWTRARLPLDELAAFSQMHAVLETLAHLELLSSTGRISETETDGVAVFSALRAGRR